jgi:hypothetical protein
MVLRESVCGVLAIDGGGLWSRAGEDETAAKVDGGFASRRCAVRTECDVQRLVPVEDIVCA